MTLTFDLFTSGSVRSDVLPLESMCCVSRLVLIAHAVFLSEYGQTHTDMDKVTDVTNHPTHASAAANNGFYFHPVVGI